MRGVVQVQGRQCLCKCGVLGTPLASPLPGPAVLHVLGSAYVGQLFFKKIV